MSIYDPWNVVPLLILSLVSFGLPCLYTGMGGGASSGRRRPSPLLQGLFFFVSSLLIYMLFMDLASLLVILYTLDPLLLLLLGRFLLPLPALLIVAINWYKILFVPSPSCLAVSLMSLGVMVVSLGALYALHLPLIMGGGAAILDPFVHVAIGVVLIAAAIYVWLERERLLRIASP